ncbi:hypothetical protein WDW86_04315 [Bdellovibrionota bacterium FG-2]
MENLMETLKTGNLEVRNFKKRKRTLYLATYFATLALGLGLGFGRSASAIEFNCPTCFANQGAGTAVLGGNIASGFSSLSQIIDASLIRTSSSPFSGLTSPQAGLVKDAPFYQGFNDPSLGQAGAFNPGFDPTFRADFWSDEKGPLFNSSAPWNQFFPTYQAKWMYSEGMATLGLPVSF